MSETERVVIYGKSQKTISENESETIMLVKQEDLWDYLHASASYRNVVMVRKSRAILKVKFSFEM